MLGDTGRAGRDLHEQGVAVQADDDAHVRKGREPNLDVQCASHDFSPFELLVFLMNDDNLYWLILDSDLALFFEVRFRVDLLRRLRQGRASDDGMGVAESPDYMRVGVAATVEGKETHLRTLSLRR